MLHPSNMSVHLLPPNLLCAAVTLSISSKLMDKKWNTLAGAVMTMGKILPNHQPRFEGSVIHTNPDRGLSVDGLMINVKGRAEQTRPDQTSNGCGEDMAPCNFFQQPHSFCGSSAAVACWLFFQCYQFLENFRFKWEKEQRHVLYTVIGCLRQK